MTIQDVDNENMKYIENEKQDPFRPNQAQSDIRYTRSSAVSTRIVLTVIDFILTRCIGQVIAADMSVKQH